jgi:hypothetical protein
LAVTPQNNEAFLREVDEELRREQFLGFWRRYGIAVGGAIVLGLAALGGVLFWQHYREQQAAAQGEQFNKVYDLLASNKPGDAEKTLADLAKSDVATYRALAVTVQADVILRDMKTDDPKQSATKLKEAAARFAAIVADKSIAQPLRDLALIRQTYAEYDQLAPQAVIDRMKPLAVAGAPWIGSAGELIAVTQLQMHQPAQARATLQRVIGDPNIPDTIRQRAVQLSSAIENGSVGRDAAAATTEEKTNK